MLTSFPKPTFIERLQVLIGLSHELKLYLRNLDSRRVGWYIFLFDLCIEDYHKFFTLEINEGQGDYGINNSRCITGP